VNDLLDAYRVLELSSNASLEEVKRAYRELTRVWHPDRFPNDKRLQQKAQERLKQINLAYELICGRGAFAPRRPSNDAKVRSTTPNTEGPHVSQQPNSPPRSQSPPPTATPTMGRRSQRQFGRGVAVFCILVAIAFTALKSYLTTAPDAHQLSRIPAFPSPTASPRYFSVSTPNPTAQVYSNAQGGDPAFTLQDSVSSTRTPVPVRRAEPVAVATPRNPVLPDSHVPVTTPSVSIRRAQPVAPTYPRPGTSSSNSFFTVGSTKDEVLTLQGSPDRFTDRMFWYGTSFVRFAGDRVVCLGIMAIPVLMQLFYLVQR
jgi:hypothetical protein